MAGTQMGQAFGQRSAYAFQRPVSAQSVGTGNVSASSLSIGSSSVDLGEIILRDTRPWIERANDAYAAASRLGQQLGVQVFPRSILKRIQYNRFTTGDNKQGRCVWFANRVLHPGLLDEYFLKNSTDERDPQTTTQLHWIDQQFRFRNAGSAKAEIDVWLLWPRRDIAANPDIVFNDGTNNYPLNTTWFGGENPPFMKYGYAPFGYTNASGTYVTPVVQNTNPDWKVSPTPFDDYFASPLENNYVTDNFDVDYRGHRIFNPGDECTYKTGVPHQQINPFEQVEMKWGQEGNITNAFSTQYAMMRRCGPIVLFRMRGGLSHLESTGSPPTATNPTMGLFSFDNAVMISDCTSPIFYGTTANFTLRGVYNNGIPSSTNQGLAANTFSWQQSAAAEQAFNT